MILNINGDIWRSPKISFVVFEELEELIDEINNINNIQKDSNRDQQKLIDAPKARAIYEAGYTSIYLVSKARPVDIMKAL